MDLSRVPISYINKAKAAILNGSYFITVYEPTKLALRSLRVLAKRYKAKLEQTGAGHTRIVFSIRRHRHLFSIILRVIKKNRFIKKHYISEDLKDYVDYGYKNFLIAIIKQLLDDELKK